MTGTDVGLARSISLLLEFEGPVCGCLWGPGGGGRGGVPRWGMRAAPSTGGEEAGPDALLGPSLILAMAPKRGIG